MIFLFSLAFANPFAPKTMKGDWAVRPIDRSLALPKGITELTVALSSKLSFGYRDAAGDYYPYADSAWYYSQARLRYAHGLSKRITLTLDIPWVWSSLQTADGDAIDTFALGDVETRILFQPWDTQSGMLAFTLALKSPSGVEWPASGRDGPGDIQGFLTGTGTTNLGAGFTAQWKPHPSCAMRISGGYTLKIPAVVGYVVEDGGFGNGILDPGDELWASGTQLLALHERLTLSLHTKYSWRSSYQLGASGSGLWMENPQELLAPTHFLDAGGGLAVEPHPLLSFRLYAAYQLLGSDTRTFATLGLEEFSPQPGWTARLEGALRW